MLGPVAQLRQVVVALRQQRDLGRYDDPLMFAPEPVTEADYVVIESTYGNRVHQPDDDGAALAEVIS